MKLVFLEHEKESVIFESEKEKADPENTQWLSDFAERVKAVGDTLGFGACEKWTVDTERYQVVSLTHDEGFITMVRRRDPAQEDLESAVATILDGS